MKKLLNTLYVTTQGAYISRVGETVVVRVEKETKIRLPIHTLEGLVCFGQVSMSPFAMGLCAERGVTVSFLTEYGKFLARVEGAVSGNVLLRRAQYRLADSPGSRAEIARAVVSAKVANSRHVLLRAARDGGSEESQVKLRDAAEQLGRVLRHVETCEGVEAVRGNEGDGARLYFGVFDHLINGDKESFFFKGRNRRPPLDNVNALLSFVYTLLAHDVRGALESVGLDPAVGFLHTDRPGRPGLALDLMEELRPVFADRLVLSLVNRRQVQAKGFTRSESGAVTMCDATRKAVLVAYQKRKQEMVTHPFLGEKVAIGLAPYVQALLLARHVRGDLDGYAAMFWR